MSENVRRYGAVGKPMRVAQKAAKEALRPDLYGLGEIGKYGHGDELPSPQVGPTMVRTPALGIPAAIAGLDEVLGDALAALGRLEERLAPMMLPESGGKEQGEVPRPVMSPLALEITQRTDVARGVRGKLLTLIERLDM